VVFGQKMALFIENGVSWVLLEVPVFSGTSSNTQLTPFFNKKGHFWPKIPSRLASGGPSPPNGPKFSSHLGGRSPGGQSKRYFLAKKWPPGGGFQLKNGPQHSILGHFLTPKWDPSRTVSTGLRGIEGSKMVKKWPKSRPRAPVGGTGSESSKGVVFEPRILNKPGTKRKLWPHFFDGDTHFPFCAVGFVV
jgi:hypothetical protein